MRRADSGFALLLLVVPVACGGEGEGGGGGSGAGSGGSAASPTVAACYDLCDAQYKDCASSISDCRQLCDLFVPGFSSDCQGKAKAFYDCGSQIEWTCSGLASMQKDSSQCQTEMAAYSPCASTQ